MQSLTFKRLNRFPTKNGDYLVAAVAKEGRDAIPTPPELFQIMDGRHTYLAAEQVIWFECGIMWISDFKARLKGNIRGCPEMTHIYYEIRRV